MKRRYIPLLLGDVFYKFSLALRCDIVELCQIFANFCLIVLASVEREVLNSSTTIEDLSIFLFSSISFCFIYFAILLFGAYALKITVSSQWIDSLSLYNVLLWFWKFSFIKIYFILYKYSHLCFPLINVYTVNMYILCLFSSNLPTILYLK